MTRLRFVFNDESRANDDAVKAIKGVIKQGGQYQVVIGNEASNLFKEFKKLGNFAEDGGGAAPQKATGNPIQRLFGFAAVIGVTYTSSVLPMLLMTPVMGWAEAFAVREGIAILPSDGKVCAPCDAAVSQMMDSRHAIGTCRRQRRRDSHSRRPRNRGTGVQAIHLSRQGRREVYCCFVRKEPTNVCIA